MSQQKQVSPLPPGRYWLTISDPVAIRDFDAWIRDMSGAAVVEASELSQNGASLFVIFNVPKGRAPFLDSGRFGFPNEAGPDVHFASDVQAVPHTPEPGLEAASELLAPVGRVFQSPFFWAIVIVALASGSLQTRRTARA